MIRGLLRLVLVVVVLVAAGAFLLGWWGSGRVEDVDESQTVGTAGVDRERAREAGAKVGERTAEAADRTAQAVDTAGEKAARAADRAGEKAAYAAEQTRKALAEGSLTAKIKAKMALDDHVEALDLNVDTVGSVVTVSGWANNQAEKDRALQLARDTKGVTHVVDKIQVKQ